MSIFWDFFNDYNPWLIATVIMLASLRCIVSYYAARGVRGS